MLYKDHFLSPTSNTSMELKQADAGLHKSMLDGVHDFPTTLFLTLITTQR